MTVQIVQFAPYKYPAGNPGPANIPLGSDPTPGNLLIAALPSITPPGPPDPFWFVVSNQQGNFDNCIWLAHFVVPGDTADLAPFYDWPPDTFSQYAAGGVWELSGASSDLLSSPFAYVEFGIPINPPPGPDFIDLTLATDTADTMVLFISFVKLYGTAFPPPPPWVTVGFSGLSLDASVQPTLDQEDINSNSYGAGHQLVGAPGAPVTYSANYSGQITEFGNFSALAIRPPVIINTNFVARYDLLNWTRPWTE